MPRLFHRPPKYSLHKGSNQAIVYLDCRICIDGEFGALRTILLSAPLIHHAATIIKDTKAQVQSFRAGENDQYQSTEMRDEEIRIIERKAMLGELKLCEFA